MPNGDALRPWRDTGHLRPQFPPSLSSPKTLRAPRRLAALTIFTEEITSAAAVTCAPTGGPPRAPAKKDWQNLWPIKEWLNGHSPNRNELGWYLWNATAGRAVFPPWD